MKGDFLDKLSTKERIFKATLEILSEEGYGNCNIRKIAEKADVNVASINYYYQNKDNLFKQVEKYLSEEIYDRYKVIIFNKELCDKEKLLKMSEELFEFLYKYPGLIELLIGTFINNFDYSSILVNKFIFNETLTCEIKDSIFRASNVNDEESVHYKYMQILSSIIFPIITITADNKLTHFSKISDFSSVEKRKKYVKSIIESVL